MSTLRRTVTAAAVLIATLLCAAPAFAKTKTFTASAPLSSGGTVTATITYTPESYYSKDIQLKITRNGTQALSKQVTGTGCGKECLVAYGFSDSSNPIHVVDVQGNGEPVVIVDLYSGGAHCCSITNFYTFNAATQSYKPYSYTWGDPGYDLEKIDGKYVFDTNDDRFAYEFTDYAASGLPLQLFSFDGTKLINITRQYPSLIAKDAAGWLSAYKAQGTGNVKDRWSDTVGVIAAWAADEDELGKSAMVASYLKTQAALGHLNSGISPELPGGAKFITNLNAFLKKAGYLS